MPLPDYAARRVRGALQGGGLLPGQQLQCTVLQNFGLWSKVLHMPLPECATRRVSTSSSGGACRASNNCDVQIVAMLHWFIELPHAAVAALAEHVLRNLLTAVLYAPGCS
jgi:hypothetical protein